MKQFRWKIVLCVLPVLAASIVVGRAWQLYQEGRGGFKLGVDLAGGTNLVYEVADPDATVDMNEMAAALKRRIDPTDLYNVTIRPVGAGRIEVILPAGSRNQMRAEEASWQKLLEDVEKKWPVREGTNYDNISRGQVAELIARIRANQPEANLPDIEKFMRENYEEQQQRRGLTSEQVERTKELIARQGSLEFRILANERDDAAAVEAARNFFVEAKKDKKLWENLYQLALTGKPPPPPRNAQGTTTFPTRDGAVHSYSWVELGPEERWNLGLNNDAKDSPLWQGAARFRAKFDAKTGQYEPGEIFVISRPRMNDVVLWSRESSNANAAPKDKDKQVEYFFLTREAEPGKAVTGDYLDVSRVRSDVDDRLQPMVRFGFTAAGGELFYELTSKNKPEGDHSRHLAILLDNQIMSAPRIQSAIRSEGSITGISSSKEVDALVTILKAGRLPATLKGKPVSENTIGATLGEDTIRSGTVAVVLAFMAVLVFMIIYYRFAGLVASVALLANLLLTVAFMIVVNATFTLPGLAGLVLMLGMAVDANVLIYERLREERDRGASLALAIRNGYDRAFPTIIDTHLTSIFTAIVLYIVGNDQLKGFGISLTVGLIISLFTSLFMTRTFFDLALAQGWLTKLTMMRFFTRPNINFMGIRFYAFTFTVVVSVLGVVLFLARGERGLNIDFVGGTAYTSQLVRLESTRDVRGLLEKQKERLHVLDVKALDNSGTLFEITYDEGAGKKDVRVVRLADATTAEDIRQRAGELPDFSLVPLYSNSEDLSSGDKHKRFKILTLERAPELVETAISRLLGDRLQRVAMTWEITEGDGKQARTARLSFTDPNTGKPAYASPARVGALLSHEMEKDLESVARQLVIKGEAKEEEGLYRQMLVNLPESVDRAKFERALEALQKQYADMPQPDGLENFDSLLANETRLRALYAIMASWGAILLYLWFRFGSWTFGLAAVLCLVHDLCFTLGAIAACHYIDHYVPGLASLLGLQDFKIDLAAVASLLTLVGYSVNDTIVVFDRIREVRGKNPALTAQMINDSVNQTLSRTLLASLTTWLVVIVLYIWGGAGVHLFAFVMVVGVLIGTYSSIYVASPLLLLLGEGKQAATRERQNQPAGTTA